MIPNVILKSNFLTSTDSLFDNIINLEYNTERNEITVYYDKQEELDGSEICDTINDFTGLNVVPWFEYDKNRIGKEPDFYLDIEEYGERYPLTRIWKKIKTPMTTIEIQIKEKNEILKGLEKTYETLLEFKKSKNRWYTKWLKHILIR